MRRLLVREWQNLTAPVPSSPSSPQFLRPKPYTGPGVRRVSALRQERREYVAVTKLGFSRGGSLGSRVSCFLSTGLQPAYPQAGPRSDVFRVLRTASVSRPYKRV